MAGTTGAPDNLPYPEGTDQPYVHLDMKALAEAVAARLAAMRLTIPKGFKASVVTDGTGYATFPHGAPYTPNWATVSIGQNSAERTVVVTAVGPTNVTVRYLSTDGTSTAGANLVVGGVVYP